MAPEDSNKSALRLLLPKSLPAPYLVDSFALQRAFAGLPLEAHGPIWDQAWKLNQVTWDRGIARVTLYEALTDYPELFDGRHPDLKQLGGSGGYGLGPEAASGAIQLSTQKRKPTKKRKMALVPGCGRGYYSSLLVHVFGYQVYALDISKEALNQATEHRHEWRKVVHLGGSQDPIDFSVLGSERHNDHGNVKYLLGDFFDDQWMRDAEIEGLKFDLIFDYDVSPL